MEKKTNFFECEGLMLDIRKDYVINYHNLKIDDQKLVTGFRIGGSECMESEMSEYFRALNLLGVKFTVEEEKLEKKKQNVCIDNESPIFETLKENECYIISKTKDNILVLSNHAGLVGISRIPIPKESKKVKEGSRSASLMGKLAVNCALCRTFLLTDSEHVKIVLTSHVQRHVRHIENLNQQESVEEGIRVLFSEEMK